jgi:hypothetical protein
MPKYVMGRLPFNARQMQRMLSAAKTGAPVSLMLGRGDLEIDVVLTPKQHEVLSGGGKRVKFSPAQLRTMVGMGVFSDLGDMATPLAEEGISAGLNAVAPGLGEIAGPILGEMVGPLIKTIGNELDYAVSKKPNFKALSKNRARSKAVATAQLAQSPEELAQTYKRTKSTLQKGGPFTRGAVKRLGSNVEEFKQGVQSRAAQKVEAADALAREHKSAFMAAANGGRAKKGGAKLAMGGYRRTAPGAKRPAEIKFGGANVGQQAAEYIRRALMAELKN